MGIYPTVETLGAQLVLVLLFAFALQTFWPKRSVALPTVPFDPGRVAIWRQRSGASSGSKLVWRRWSAKSTQSRRRIALESERVGVARKFPGDRVLAHCAAA